MSMDVDVIKEGIKSLIRAGYYKDKEKLLDEAFRTMLEVRPALKIEMAIELYKEERISLSRAAEIAGMPIESFKNILEQRGIKRIVKAPSEDKIKKGVELLIGWGNHSGYRHGKCVRKDQAIGIAKKVVLKASHCNNT